MDRENMKPRGDWKGMGEEGQKAPGANPDETWKGEKPMHEEGTDDNKNLRRDLGQNPSARNK